MNKNPRAYWSMAREAAAHVRDTYVYVRAYTRDVSAFARRCRRRRLSRRGTRFEPRFRFSRLPVRSVDQAKREKTSLLSRITRLRMSHLWHVPFTAVLARSSPPEETFIENLLPRSDRSDGQIAMQSCYGVAALRRRRFEFPGNRKRRVAGLSRIESESGELLF